MCVCVCVCVCVLCVMKMHKPNRYEIEQQTIQKSKYPINMRNGFIVIY